MEEESFNLGLEAYQNREYAQAIEYLLEVDPQQWDAQLYLGMSYYMAGRHIDARNKFAHMRDNCPVTPLREKALSAYLMVHSKIRQTEQLKKEEDEITVEW
jgi:cytochrome c-type biogenesis protein CcmH/NrfG